MLLNDPLTLYKDGKSRRIPAIDAPGWIANGWSDVDVDEEKELPPPTPYSLLPTPPSDLMENFSTTDEQTSVVKRRGKNGGNTVSEG
ncbi:MAG: hypothetical protein ACFKPT_02550 [Gloeotrichia echinulata GP01]